MPRPSLHKMEGINMFKSIFRAGKHGELWCSVCRERVKGGRGEGKGAYVYNES